MFMMVGNPLLIWGQLTNPKNVYGLCKRPETEKELRKPKDYPIWLQSIQNSNPEAKVV